MRYVEGEYFYSDASMRRAGKAVWGNSVWMGRLTFPMNEPRQLGASTLSDGQKSSQPSRIGQRNQTEHFDLSDTQDKKQPSVTIKKRRAFTMKDMDFLRSGASNPGKLTPLADQSTAVTLNQALVNTALAKTGETLMKPLPCLTLFVESGRKFKLPSGETFDSLRRPQPDSSCSTDSSTSTSVRLSKMDASLPTPTLRPLLLGEMLSVMKETLVIPQDAVFETADETKARLQSARQSEAQRLKERLSQIPWHAQRAQEQGESYWLELAASYQGD